MALCHFTLFYNLWDMRQNTDCTRNNCAYFDVILKMRMWVNKDRRGREGDPPIPLGIENRGNAASIHSKLNEVFWYVSG